MQTELERFRNYFSNSQKTALILEDGRELNFQALAKRAAAIALHLKKSGVKSDDRVLLSLESREDFTVAYFSALFGAHTVVPINPSLPPADLEYIKTFTKPVFELSSLDGVGDCSIDEALNLLNQCDTKKIWAIFFTSGTTNRPKGVCHKIEGLLENALAFNIHVGLNEKTRMMHIMPISYMAGFLNTLLCPLLAGGTVVLAKQFSAADASQIWSAAKQHVANTIWLSPTMAAFLARLNRDTEISQWTEKNLQNVFVGTAPLGKSQKESFEKCFKVKCLESYGMSEVLLVSSNRSKEEVAEASTGTLLEGVQVEAREGGKLFIQSKYAMAGYWNADKCAPVWPFENQWLDSGDIGHVDEEKRLFITGREKDLIIKGGVNISPRAIEEILMQHENVSEAAVIGVTHPFWGEDIKAFVILKDPAKVFDDKDLKEFCRDKMNADTIPTEIVVAADFPRTVTGKIQKNKLATK
jgi:acyl-CoA synthetase (AMP-forming)/AMP-acid ligase II